MTNKFNNSNFLMMFHRVISVLFVSINAFAFGLPIKNYPIASISKPISHQLWDDVLKKYVSDDGKVNYKGLKNDRKEFDEYLNLLRFSHPDDNWTKNEQMTYWINAYNAFTVELILKHYPVKSIRDIGGLIKIPGIDAVPEILQVCRENFMEAEKYNSWFKSEFIELKVGDALRLPLEDKSVDVAAQNCLFNIFIKEDLKKALKEMYRVLKPRGRLVLSDPVSEESIPDSLRNNEVLRAMCLSGAMSSGEYIKLITEVGFGTIEIRTKRPYRILGTPNYNVQKNIFIESIEICAIKAPMPNDGPCVFTGKTAIYFGSRSFFDDGKGHVLNFNLPLSVCDKTANALKSLGRKDIFISESTWFYDGGGCC